MHGVRGSILGTCLWHQQHLHERITSKKLREAQLHGRRRWQSSTSAYRWNTTIVSAKTEND
ncbi:hypothetical protein V3C99_010745 [Haemonchus contortus]|uniref:Uncharacterized protein n=1 Tax=Haemonchus contortus TaxID=6289 RepID=A0A7I4Y7E8_HAECO